MAQLAAEAGAVQTRQRRSKHGGVRLATHGVTFFERKQNLLSTQAIKDIRMTDCACPESYMWRCVNELPDFTERITDLRQGRFQGKLARCPIYVTKLTAIST